MNRDSYDRFSSREDPDPDKFPFEIGADTLPDPEDLIDNSGMYHFIGFYCHAMTEYHRIGQIHNRLADEGKSINSRSICYEDAIETWLDRAQDWLPDWAQSLYIKEAGKTND